jgi:hypothetical protein
MVSEVASMVACMEIAWMHQLWESRTGGEYTKYKNA